MLPHILWICDHYSEVSANVSAHTLCLLFVRKYAPTFIQLYWAGDYGSGRNEIIFSLILDEGSFSIKKISVTGIELSVFLKFSDHSLPIASKLLKISSRNVSTYSSLLLRKLLRNFHKTGVSSSCNMFSLIKYEYRIDVHVTCSFW